MGDLKRKLEGEIEIRVEGGDAFHEIFEKKPHHISNIHPDFVQDCELHQGVFGEPGSIICWRYFLDGKKQTEKEVLEMVDKENKMIRFRVLEGDLLEDYHTFVFISHVIPQGDGLSLVKWTFEYQKKHQAVPEPSSLMDALIHASKLIDE